MLIQNPTQNYKYNNYNAINYSKNKSVNFAGQVLVNKQIVNSVAQKTAISQVNWFKSLFCQNNSFQTFQKLIGKKLQQCNKMANVKERDLLRNFYEKIFKIGEQNPNFSDKLITVVKAGLLSNSQDKQFLREDDTELLRAQLNFYDKLSKAYNPNSKIPAFFKTKDGGEVTKEDLYTKTRLIDKFNPPKTVSGVINDLLRNVLPAYYNKNELEDIQLSIIDATNACNEYIVNKLLNKTHTLDIKDNDEHRDIIEIAQQVSTQNKNAIEVLTRKEHVHTDFILKYVNTINKYNISNLHKMTKHFSIRQLSAIIYKLNDENIKFLNKLLKQKWGDIRKDDIVRIFDSYNECNAKSLYYILNNIQRADFQRKTKNIADFGYSINKTNHEWAEKWIKLPNVDLLNLKDILDKTNKNNLELANDLISDKSFDNSKIPNLIKYIETEENSSFIRRLHSTTKIQSEELNKIAVLLNFIDLAIKDSTKYDVSEILSDAIRLQEKYAEIMDESGYRIENKIKDLYSLFSTETQQVIAPDKKGQILLLKQLLSNNSPKIEQIIKTTDFDKYKEGIPLKYPRNELYKNITNKILVGVNDEDKHRIMVYYDMHAGEKTYDGLLNIKDPKDLIPQLKTQKAKNATTLVYKEIVDFVRNNEVTTKDKNLNNILNGIVKGIPSYLSIFGKTQHNTHDYTIDIHSLKVLQSAMNNPLYETLSDESKIVLKLSAILHDIGKREGIRDPGHANKSARYADAILDTLPLTDNIKSRTLNIIKNHHWFEGYNKSEKHAGDIAVLCRYPEDFEIFQMLAKADLESVNKTFHLDVTGQRNQELFDRFFDRRMYNIENALNSMFHSTNFIFDSKILNNGNKFPKMKILTDNDIFHLKVLDLNNLKANDNLEQYGFAKGTTKKDLRFLVHMLNPIKQKLESTKALLDDSTGNQAWSTSYIKPNYNPTYCKYKFGFIFDAKPSDIAEASSDNIGSGYKKNMEDFSSIVLSDNNNRTFLSKSFKEELKKNGINLSYEDSVSLAKYLLKKKHITAINNDFYIGKTLIKAKSLVESIKTTQDKLFNGNYHNEVVVLNPKLQGLIAKVNSIEECPIEFLSFAHKHNLPIVLMKNCE